MENFEDDDDTHFCIKCHATISGLENYVRHRQAGCCRLAEKEAAVQGAADAPSTVSYPEVPNADAFFNSLELQSSAKKPPRRAARTKANRDKKEERQSEARRKTRRCQTEAEDASSKGLVSGKLNILSVDPELDNPTDHLGIPSLVGFPDIVSSSASKPAVTVSSSKNCAASMMAKIETPNYNNPPKQETRLENSLETFMTDDQSVPKPSGAASKRREVWLGDNILADHNLGNSGENKGIIPHSSALSRYADYDYADDVESDDDCTLDEDMAEDESCSETDDANDPEYPPQGYTGGKWRPGLATDTQVDAELVEDEAEPDEDNPERPPPSHTGGKWKPTDTGQGQRSDEAEMKDEKEATEPPPGHTRGKWVPGARSDQNNGFYCSPCGRRLASRLVYNRHLLSELHAKRSIKELDGALRLPRGAESLGLKESRGTWRRRVATWKVQENEELRSSEGKKKSRNRRREVIKCEGCRTRVRRSQMGKHLLSHYHCRVAGVIPRTPSARAFLLNNMANVVRQCPFQCAGCRFYCNTEETFLLHWRSELHTNAHREISGSYHCTSCDFWCDDNSEMDNHVTSLGHRQVVSMVNGSVPVVITRQRNLPCDTCGQGFRYNMQLKQHVSETGHAAETASDVYQSRICCPQCNQLFRSLIALQRHQLATHVKDQPGQSSSPPEPYFCSTCSLNFPSAEEAVKHRKTPRHKELVDDRKNALRGIKKQRKCPNCDLALADLQQLKQHLLRSHIDLCHRCPRCGVAFALPQDLALHTRKGECVRGEVSKARSESVDEDEEEDEEEEDEEAEEEEEAAGEGSSGSFRCSQCAYVTNSQAEFIYHETLHAGCSVEVDTLETVEGSTAKIRPTFRCPICKKSFKRQHYLLRHIRMHTGEKPFPCPSCRTPFPNRTKLNLHIASCSIAGSSSWVEGAGRHRNYVCLECNNAFYTNHALQQHMLRHTGKKFLCGLPGCPTALRTPGELRTHRDRVHDALETNKRHHCPECSYQGVSAAQLRRHQKQRHKNRGEATTARNSVEDTGEGAAAGDAGAGGFRCPYTDCHFKSKLKSHLRRHLRLHTGSKPYRCSHCPYVSNNFENLRKHVLSTKIHPGKSIYECTHCATYRTNFSRELRAHLLQEHEESFPTAEVAANHVAGMYSAEPDPSAIIDNQSSLSCRILLLKRENVQGPEESMGDGPTSF